MASSSSVLRSLLLLALLCSPSLLYSQEGTPIDGLVRGSSRGQPERVLEQNYPNPFSEDTRIAFSVGSPGSCEDHSRLYRVALKIYNVLAQFVATPSLEGTGDPIAGLSLPCGRYTAYWNGKKEDPSAPAASGVYLYRLTVDGKPSVRKMLLAR